MTVNTNGTDLALNDISDNQYIWDADSGEIPQDIRDRGVDEGQELVKETLSLSMDDAKQMAEQFLSNVGISDFTCTDAVKACEPVEFYQNESTGYRREYILRYMRTVNGVALDYNAVLKHSEGRTDAGYVKKDWPNECMEFRINDDGIVGFDYLAPIELTETVVAQAGMKSFEEIKPIFEKMVVVSNVPGDYDPSAEDYTGRMQITVDQVTLGYARISEENNFDSGLLVPIWDFEGTKAQDYASARDHTVYQSVMAVNAIDGTVIDQELGY